MWLMMLSMMMLLACMATLPVSAAETNTMTHVAVPHTINPSEPSTTRPVNPPVSYGLGVMAAADEIVFSGLCGNEITFTAEDFCRALNLSEIDYITIRSLPSEEIGTLYAGSVGVSAGQTISAGNISKLSFAATEDDQPCETTMKVTVNGQGYDMTCRLRLTDRINYTPTVSLVPEVTLSMETYTDLTAMGTLSAYDPEEDEMTFEIVRYATHGRVALTDKHTGAYTYTPDSGYVGTDAFTYVVRDQYGNYSTSAVVQITISERSSAVTYADIGGIPQAAAILKVSAAGIMNGTRVGAEQYFKPTEAMSRAEFLVIAMHAAGITDQDVAGLTAPSFADADQLPEAMAKYVSLAVRRGYVAGKQVNGALCFCPDEAITRAEAAVILSNIIGYAKQTTVNAFADADAMPSWSVKAMTSLKSLGILTPGDGKADARSLMTRADTALWLDRTMRVMAQG